MKKSEIRKKILKIRRQNKAKSSKINFQLILKVLKGLEIKNKIIGGYYPYNYEIDAIEILKKFEKQNNIISLPKIKKKTSNGF